MNCGECTMCCLFFPIPEKGLKEWEDCAQRLQGVGCKEYDHRPMSCRQIVCAYAQMRRCSKDLRPDKCGIIFEKVGSDIFLGTAKNGITDPAKRQLLSFRKQGFNIILNKQNCESVILPVIGETKETVWRKYQTELRKIRNDSTKLYN